jgi:predicted small secreted protein
LPATTEPFAAAAVAIVLAHAKESEMAMVSHSTFTEKAYPGLVFGFIGMLLMALTLSSCNTAEGVGEDISSAGDAVSDTAEDVAD